jgi:predicted ester cyclase
MTQPVRTAKSKDWKQLAIEQAFAHYKRSTLDAYLELYHPDAKLHFVPPGLPPGREGMRLRDLALLAAFPDAQVVFEGWVIGDDVVAARFRFNGTHRGEFMGLAPTNKRVSVPGLTIMRFENKLVVERWSEMNYLGLLQELGAAPFPL